MNLVRFDKKTRVGAVAEILGQAKDGDFVFVWFALPRAELGAVTAFVAEGVKVQGLVAILLSLIHISEPTRLRRVAYCVLCL